MARRGAGDRLAVAAARDGDDALHGRHAPQKRIQVDGTAAQLEGAERGVVLVLDEDAAAQALAEALGLHRVPSFHRDLLRGVASYWIEFFEQVQPDVVLVPIGQGSGICACAAARACTGAASRIVGVVSAHATAYKDSFESGRLVEAPVSTQLADGMACRVPDQEALAIIRREVDDIVAVRDDEVAQAMRIYFSDTHNVAEGAGAAPLAAALQRREAFAGRSLGLALTGGNVDRAVFASVLAA
jgi:threonine dehydratase